MTVSHRKREHLLAHQGVIRGYVVHDRWCDISIIDVHFTSTDDVASGMLQEAFNPLGVLL